MLALLTLLACGGGPSVTVTSGLLPDAHTPGTLLTGLERDFQRPILSCYKASDSDATGTVVLTVHGSHGILKQEVSEGADPALAACARAPLDAPRLQRTYGDGDNPVGFTLTVTFAR